MKKLFLVGSGPLPCEKNVQCQTAFGLRTWQFLSAIESFDGEITLVLLADPNHYSTPPEFAVTRDQLMFGKKVAVIHLEKNSADFSLHLGKAYADTEPTVCAGVNLMPAYVLAEMKPSVPFWADLNGWSLAEAQSQAYVYQDDAYLPVIWERERAVLETADRFSTVSRRHKYALIGQLGAIGGLNHQTEGYDFVTVVRNANEVPKLAKGKGINHKTEANLASIQMKSRKVRKNSRETFDLHAKVGEDAFIIFFSGAYNTWLDEENLFIGIERAMKKNPRIFFVSTGGGVAGLSNKVFDQFKARIEASNYKDRFIFLGWLDTEELLACYDQVDVAINLDRNNTESRFGARNRINEWLVYGVPVISTVATEITKELAEHELLIPVKLEDADHLAKQLSHVVELDLREMADRAREFAAEAYSYERTVQKFSTFIQNPKFSPSRDYFLTMKPSVIDRVWFRVRNDGVGVLVEYVGRKLGLRK